MCRPDLGCWITQVVRQPLRFQRHRCASAVSQPRVLRTHPSWLADDLCARHPGGHCSPGSWSLLSSILSQDHRGTVIICAMATRASRHRAEVLEELTEWWEDLRDRGTGSRVVLVPVPHGWGRSRLLEEFRGVVEDLDGPLTFSINCTPLAGRTVQAQELREALTAVEPGSRAAQLLDLDTEDGSPVAAANNGWVGSASQEYMVGESQLHQPGSFALAPFFFSAIRRKR